MSKNRSEALSQNLDNTIETWVLDRLKQLESLLDPGLFEQFNARILDIVEKHPGSEDFINGELERTTLVAQNQRDAYNHEYQSILLSAANDDVYWNDEDQGERPYRWLGKAA